jgi:hypothetical protein
MLGEQFRRRYRGYLTITHSLDKKNYAKNTTPTNRSSSVVRSVVKTGRFESFQLHTEESIIFTNSQSLS